MKENKSKGKLNIMLCLSRFGVGGIQTFVIHLANELTKRGHNIYIYCIYPEYADTGLNILIDPRVRVIALSKSHLAIKVLNTIRNAVSFFIGRLNVKEALNHRYFKHVLRKHSVDVVHNNIEAGDVFCEIAKKLHLPFIVTLHGAYKGKTIENLKQTHIKFIHENASKIAFLSQSNLMPFQLLGLETSISKFSPIPNGMPGNFSKSIHRRKRERVVFGMVARGVPEKGWSEALDAYLILRSHFGEKVALLFVADGDYVASLCEPYADVGVTYWRPLKDVSEALDDIDVGLLPSYSEEMPFTVIEYLSAGMPVVASDVGAIRDMLTNKKGQVAGHTIQLDPAVNKCNSTEVFEIMKDYVLCAGLIEAKSSIAIECFAEQFDIEKCADRYEEVYEEVAVGNSL